MPDYAFLRIFEVGVDDRVQLVQRFFDLLGQGLWARRLELRKRVLQARHSRGEFGQPLLRLGVQLGELGHQPHDVC